VSEEVWDPDGYLAMMAAEVPGYAELQEQLLAATAGLTPGVILALGTGTGETARRVLAAHPHARLHGIDSSAAMLGAERAALPADRVALREARLRDRCLPDRSRWSSRRLARPGNRRSVETRPAPVRQGSA